MSSDSSIILAFRRGVEAVLGNRPEPYNPYPVNTKEYSSFCDGFSFRIKENGSINLNEAVPQDF